MKRTKQRWEDIFSSRPLDRPRVGDLLLLIKEREDKTKVSFVVGEGRKWDKSEFCDVLQIPRRFIYEQVSLEETRRYING